VTSCAAYKPHSILVANFWRYSLVWLPSEMISLQVTTFKASLKASLSTTHPHDDFLLQLLLLWWWYQWEFNWIELSCEEPIHQSCKICSQHAIRVIISSPCLWARFHSLFPSLSDIRKVRKLLLNLSMKCWNSTFNAQGSRLITVVVQIGAVKIYVTALEEALEKTWKTGWNSV